MTNKNYSAVLNKYEKYSNIYPTKAAFNKKRALFTSTLDLELRKKLVKCYV